MASLGRIRAPSFLFLNHHLRCESLDPQRAYFGSQLTHVTFLKALKSLSIKKKKKKSLVTHPVCVFQYLVIIPAIPTYVAISFLIITVAEKSTKQ